ncbi:hypothetical protein M407DRAFT_244696 [Tulasnella calospora MUT 4182]|uniref:Uncharacterized protein n=1 Tax=Tulasnella calospora MUT 4182 TaxID=1051891 RepID=A0A0C3QDK7_9AGAM|nr:hypothetical protein M407DRAFT_244696 [Tulasnella calospora MUT 4182]
MSGFALARETHEREHPLQQGDPVWSHPILLHQSRMRLYSTCGIDERTVGWEGGESVRTIASVGGLHFKDVAM